MSFAPEPAQAHGREPQTPSTAVLLCNLGTPDEPTPAALRRYLAEFLGDPRVVEIPRALWLPLLHGLILRTRPAKSAAKYAGIWMPEGSPLKVWSEKQLLMLRGYLGERGHRLTLRLAMRYGNPSIPAVLDELHAQGLRRLLVVPMYPQYSSTTTASIVDAVAQWSSRIRTLPEIRFVNRFHDHPAYVAAVARRISAHWAREGRPDKLVMSFHGIPQRNLELGDPYHCECLKTARLVRERLGVSADDVVVTFQSRFGRAQWLQPYTEPTLVDLARRGVRRVDVVCPGFVADCLETLEEIAMEVRDAFLGAGGQVFHHIPCLNDQHEWILALTELVQEHLQGWDTRSPPDTAALAAQAERARALGAPA
ncbi:ferrochelatase [Piscinibacter sakaiensis]|uniref:Ferrochelatase n=1 Tax=Piscinibacter sakaiensis TaxID=1547922 RepID=A0A0K8NWC1_PISS1|nr:ferrochelatase [Piscinibacter sakaiensis]GAP34604.1 ferrochelatase [Piscinibacter sakaiensis]